MASCDYRDDPPLRRGEESPSLATTVPESYRSGVIANPALSPREETPLPPPLFINPLNLPRMVVRPLRNRIQFLIETVALNPAERVGHEYRRFPREERGLDGATVYN